MRIAQLHGMGTAQHQKQQCRPLLSTALAGTRLLPSKYISCNPHSISTFAHIAHQPVTGCSAGRRAAALVPARPVAVADAQRAHLPALVSALAVCAANPARLGAGRAGAARVAGGWAVVAASQLAVAGVGAGAVLHGA